MHVIGKVLYAKRTEEPETSLSQGMILKNVPKSKLRNQLVIDPEELLDNLPISTEHFVGFLHQNYMDFFSNIQDVCKVAENFSLSDPYFNEWTVSCHLFVILELILLLLSN